jgi:pimeloyl-ACP methyl ester carboxylesterase
VRSGRVMEKKRFLVAEADYHTDRPEHLVLGRGARFATTAIRQEWTCNYPALSDTPEQTERRLKLIAMAQSGEFKSVCDTLWPLFVHPTRHNDVALKRALFKMMDDTGPETSIRQQKAIMSRPDSRSSLGAIHCPTLVLVGNEDALTPVSYGFRLIDSMVRGIHASLRSR